jgi:hypothetical protein
MIKSGLIVGAAAFVLIFGNTLIHPFCAPCMGLFPGLAAGYLAGVFDKPINSGESIKKGGIAGAIAAVLGIIGGLIAAVVNTTYVNAANIESINRALGIPNYNLSHSDILIYQIFFSVCVGIINIDCMAVLGAAGGALWYQISGKKPTGTMLPPQEPIPPSI